MCWEKCNILVCTRASVYCVMTAGKLEQYYKNTEEWTMQHSGNSENNLTCSIQCQQYMNSYDNNYSQTILTLIQWYTAFFSLHNKVALSCAQFSYCARNLAFSTWLYSGMYNYSWTGHTNFICTTCQQLFYTSL